MAATLIPFQQSLRPSLPTIEGNADYRQTRDELLCIDRILRETGLENKYVAAALEQWLAGLDPSQNVRPSVVLDYQELTLAGPCRCDVARTYLQENFRGFAARLADSPLLQRFCLVDEIDRVKVPAKSTLQRYAHWTDEKTLQEVIHETLRQAHQHPEKLQLDQPVDWDACFLDTTCLKANIHYPVDWVLLRDATRTLMKGVDVMRGQGLRHRMEEPALFIKRMNQLCIQTTHAPKQTDSKKHRKKMLRKMDKLIGTVAEHARRYGTDPR